MLRKKENKILVIYVGVSDIESNTIEDYLKSLASKILPTSFIGEIILLPIAGYDIKIDCINPKYVTSKKLRLEHNEQMKILNEELQNQINQLKEKNEINK